MLFDDEEQLEVRHVISLAHHDISIYSGGDHTSEGELFIKRNALCLSRRITDRESVTDDSHTSKPFYLFSENCSAKEDFYFALLKNQEQTFPGLGTCPPKPKQFDIKDIITLVQRLHSSEENIHSRWLNAMIGRIFLSLYRTKDLENFIREKITKKISRVKTPSYLTNIAIRNIDTGEAAPFFYNLKLKEFTVDGECVVETDMRYAGNFRIEVAATAKIDLGARIKAREVNLVLALVLKRIEGHMLFKIKAPPSNRIWLSFQTMPKMEMAIEPIVSARQITYTVILRQIENRIKEVFAETLVQPFWDDVPFFKTEHKEWRGGIFEGDDAVESSEPTTVEASPNVPIPEIDGAAVVETEVVVPDDQDAPGSLEQPPPLSPRPIEKVQTMPPLASQPPATGLFGRKLGGNKLGGNSSAAASVASLDSRGSAATTSRSPHIIKGNVEPVVATEAAHADLFKPSTSPPDHATSLIAALHSKAQQEVAPITTPVGSPSKNSVVKSSAASSSSSKDETLDATTSEHSDGTAPSTRRNTVSSHGSYEGHVPPSPNGALSHTGSLGRKFFMKRENSNASMSTTSTTASGGGEPKRNNTLAAVTNAANQARQWGWNAIQRQKDARRNSEAAAAAASQQVDLSQPMGRGQPLPPPGTPLPGPTNGKTKIAPIAVPKRKLVPPPASVPEEEESPPLASSSIETAAAETVVAERDTDGERPKSSRSQREAGRDKEHARQPPPLPQRRRRGASQLDNDDKGEAENMLVISAPYDSEPATPLNDDDAQDDGKDFFRSASVVGSMASGKGIPRKPVPVPITVIKHVDEGTAEHDTTPVLHATSTFAAQQNLRLHEKGAHNDNNNHVVSDPLTTELLDAELENIEDGGKPLVAMPLSTTPPSGPTMDDDDDFSGWMDESSQQPDEEEEEKARVATAQNRAEELLQATVA